MQALLVGRFHALTKGQEAWLASLRDEPVDRLVCVVTSADHAGTRRNPLDADTRAALVGPALERSGKPWQLVKVADVPDGTAWVQHLQDALGRTLGARPSPADTVVYSANRDVEALFREAGFQVVARPVAGLTPHELVQRVAQGRPWEDEASPETRAHYGRPEVQAALRAIFGQTLLNDDGELGHQRDFQSYGAQMDAALRQKLEDFLPWVRPGCVVDKGCGTGKLLVELAARFPSSAFVGVDLSREFLRLCDENTYGSDDVAFVFGNIIERNVPEGSATTVVLSSVTHEIYSYGGYSHAALDRAFQSAFAELAPGGRLLVRDGVSPGHAPWRLRLLTAQAQETFQRFAREFKHGQGAPFDALGPDLVRLDAHLANEFLCKKDYLKNWHLEVHEEFGAHTLQGYRGALERAGFTVLQAKGYVNPWIAEHRYHGTVELFDDAGQPLPWPDTNMLLVAQKPGD